MRKTTRRKINSPINQPSSAIITPKPVLLLDAKGQYLVAFTQLLQGLGFIKPTNADLTAIKETAYDQNPWLSDVTAHCPIKLTLAAPYKNPYQSDNLTGKLRYWLFSRRTKNNLTFIQTIAESAIALNASTKETSDVKQLIRLKEQLAPWCARLDKVELFFIISLITAGLAIVGSTITGLLTGAILIAAPFVLACLIAAAFALKMLIKTLPELVANITTIWKDQKNSFIPLEDTYGHLNKQV